MQRGYIVLVEARRPSGEMLREYLRMGRDWLLGRGGNPTVFLSQRRAREIVDRTIEADNNDPRRWSKMENRKYTIVTNLVIK